MARMPPPPMKAPPPPVQQAAAAGGSFAVISGRISGPQRVVVYGPGGIGKCLGRGTPVLKHDGSVVPVESVRDGDVLMGPDSTPRIVSGTCFGYGPLYRVTPRKGDSYVVNEHHVLSLRQGSLQADRHRMVNISVHDFLKRGPSFRRDALGWRTGVDWPARSLPIDPYLFGCWLADGTATGPEITTPEPEVEEAIGSYASKSGLMVKERARKGEARTVAIVGDRGAGGSLQSILRGMGVLGNKHIPKAYLTASRQQRMELLAGILDGDGHLINGCFEIVQKRERLAEDLLFLARSLGLAAYDRVVEKTCTNSPTQARGVYRRIHISGDLDQIPNRVERKRCDKRRQIKSATVTGIRVESIGDGEFFGFAVDRDHLFLLGDFTVTHNSSLAALAPKPVFLDVEHGTGALDVPRVESVESFADLRSALQGPTLDGFQTVVLDSATKAEELAIAHTIASVPHEKGHRVTSIDGYGFGRGLQHVYDTFLLLLADLDRQVRQGRNVILIAHDCVADVPNPVGDDWIRYEPHLQSPKSGKASIRNRVVQWADHVLFLGYDVNVEEGGKGKGTGTRTIWPVERPDHVAKSRLLAEPMPFELGDGSVWQQLQMQGGA